MQRSIVAGRKAFILGKIVAVKLAKARNVIRTKIVDHQMNAVLLENVLKMVAQSVLLTLIARTVVDLVNVSIVASVQKEQVPRKRLLSLKVVTKSLVQNGALLS